MQSPPASAEATSVSRLSPMLARHAAEEDVIVDQFLQAQVLGEGGRKERSGIGHQAVVVKDDADLEGLFPRSSFGRFGISCQLPPFD